MRGPARIWKQNLPVRGETIVFWIEELVFGRAGYSRVRQPTTTLAFPKLVPVW